MEEELSSWNDRFLSGLKRGTENIGIKEGLKNRIRANELFKRQQETINFLRSIDGGAHVRELKAALDGRKGLIQQIKKIEMPQTLDELNPTRRLAGSKPFVEKALKLLPSTLFKAGIAADTVFNKNELSPIEKGIDASMVLNTPLFVADKLTEGITGKNLREGFVESGVTELGPEFFASKYLSY